MLNFKKKTKKHEPKIDNIVQPTNKDCELAQKKRVHFNNQVRVRSYYKSNEDNDKTYHGTKYNTKNSIKIYKKNI